FAFSERLHRSAQGVAELFEVKVPEIGELGIRLVRGKLQGKVLERKRRALFLKHLEGLEDGNGSKPAAKGAAASVILDDQLGAGGRGPAYSGGASTRPEEHELAELR